VDTNLATRWRIIAAAVAGTSHLEKALPCQDAYAYCVLPGGELLATVSDGAGSAGRSQDGARCSADWALAGLAALCQGETPQEEAGWQAAIIGVFTETRQKLAEYAIAEVIPLNELAATLTCALINSEWLVVGQIGDGAAILEEADGSLFLSVRPLRGEYANEANFLAQPDAVAYTVVTATRRTVQALALTTDGLLRLALKLPEYDPHPQFFHPLFSYAREAADETRAQVEIADFLASERVCVRTDDDKTLLLAVRVDQPERRVQRYKRRRRKDDRI